MSDFAAAVSETVVGAALLGLCFLLVASMVMAFEIVVNGHYHSRSWRILGWACVLGWVLGTCWAFGRVWLALETTP